MQELEFIKAQPKEKRLEYYFQCLSEDWRPAMEELELTGEDVRDYQRKKEQEVSMKPGDKRKLVVKNVVKKFLKEAGYRCKGNVWWRELEDGWLLFYMKTSRFNSAVTGSSFCFQISASRKDKIVDTIDKQWIYNQTNSLNHRLFLPYCGFLDPNARGLDYCIDGYRNFLPSDIPVEEIMEQVGRDLKDYLLAQLEKVHRMADWDLLYQEKQAYYSEKGIRLLRYYTSAHSMVCSMENMPALLQLQKDLDLTQEDILSHFDWLSIIQRNSWHPYLDARTFIIQSLQ